METWLFGDSWHELTNGQGEDAQGGQASEGTVDTPCLLCSGAFDVVVGRPLGYHVIAGEGNAGTSRGPISARPQFELRKLSSKTSTL